MRNGKVLLAERVISPRAYKLKNGNFLIETELLDNVHLIALRLEIEPNEAKIVKASGEMQAIPYRDICPKVLLKVKKLKGLVIQRGVLKEVSAILGGEKGCVHLRNIATIAVDFAAAVLAAHKAGFIFFSPDFESQPEEVRREMSQKFLKGTCLAFPKD